MIKVLVGDQLEDIELQIRDLCIDYIQNLNFIILVVCVVNIDMVIFEFLKLVREVDLDGKNVY